MKLNTAFNFCKHFCYFYKWNLSLSVCRSNETPDVDTLVLLAKRNTLTLCSYFHRMFMFLLLVSVTVYRCIEKRHSKTFLPHFSSFFLKIFLKACWHLFVSLAVYISFIGFKMWGFSRDISCLRLLHFITLFIHNRAKNYRYKICSVSAI